MLQSILCFLVFSLSLHSQALGPGWHLVSGLEGSPSELFVKSPNLLILWTYHDQKWKRALSNRLRTVKSLDSSEGITYLDPKRAYFVYVVKDETVQTEMSCDLQDYQFEPGWNLVCANSMNVEDLLNAYPQIREVWSLRDNKWQTKKNPDVSTQQDVPHELIELESGRGYWLKIGDGLESSGKFDRDQFGVGVFR